MLLNFADHLLGAVLQFLDKNRVRGECGPLRPSRSDPEPPNGVIMLKGNISLHDDSNGQFRDVTQIAYQHIRKQAYTHTEIMLHIRVHV